MTVRFVTGFLNNQQGQALVEYAYMLLCIAVIAVGAFAVLGLNVLDMMNGIAI